MKITTQTQYLPEHCDPENNRFVFSYTISITNTGNKSVQLKSRYWHIEDGNAQIQEVKGEGVIGEQPHIAPGETFEYTSGTVLPTRFATMQGHYTMENEDGSTFDAPISPFVLAPPGALH